MKIATREIDSFLKKPGGAVMAVLVYGPDRGLVSERADLLVKAQAGNLADPFRIAQLSTDTLKKDPARLADEALALSLAGGGRAVRLPDATDALAPVLESFLSDNKDRNSGDIALIVVEAGQLGPRASLRKLFEGAPNAAALACYEDDARTLEPLIRDTLGQAGLTFGRDALTYLSASLGGDRAQSRRELDKLVLYMGDETKVTLAHARAIVGDSAGLNIEAIALAAASGDYAGLDTKIMRAYGESAHPVQIIRSAIRHFQRLHLARGFIESDNLSPGDAIKRLRPPPIFKIVDQIAAQLRAWDTRRLARALDVLTEAEVKVKSTGMPVNAVAHRALMRIAGQARKKAA